MPPKIVTLNADAILWLKPAICASSRSVPGAETSGLIAYGY